MDQAPPDTPAPDDAPAGGKAGGRRAGLGCAFEIIETLVLTIVIFFGIQTFVAQPFRVEQSSMEDTFAEGDYVLVDRLSALWSPYADGQVVVFHPPANATDRKEPYIKRVIGVGGETVEIRPDGSVAVNGVTIDEPYLFRNDVGVVEPTEASGDETRWIVPDGELFVMGDHRGSVVGQPGLRTHPGRLGDRARRRALLAALPVRGHRHSAAGERAGPLTPVAA